MHRQYLSLCVKLPVAGQLEQALKRLRENSQTMTELRQKARKSEAEADGMEKALNRVQGELLRREREMAELRMNVTRLQQSASEVKQILISTETSRSLFAGI